MSAIFAGHRPLVAILRGIRPNEVEAVFEALVANGIGLVEVPLNSPDPFTSIARLAAISKGRAQVGAGTVLTTEDVARTKSAGGQMVVSPNCDAAVIRATKAAGMTSYPGVFTPSEAFAALAAGADALKFFPAEVLDAAGVKAMSAVLPKGTVLLAVGGVDASNIGDWMKAGIAGFGIGSGLFKPGMSAADVGAKARAMVSAYDAATR